MSDRNGYIGRAPSDSSVIVARQTNQPTGVTTNFVFNSGYDIGYLDVYVNGSKLINAVDYQASDTRNVILTTAATGGDILEFVAYKAFNLTNVVTGSIGDLNVGGSLDVNGNLDVGGNLTGNGSGITGIVTTITAGDFISVSGPTGNVTITGLANTANIVSESAIVSGSVSIGTTLSVLGDVSIGGTLTCGDITNIESIGIITARSDVSIADKIIHTGDSNTAIRFPSDNTFTVETDGSERVRVTSNGNIGINTNNPSRLLTVNGGASVAVAQFTNGTSGVGADDGFQILHFPNGQTQLINRENNTLEFYTNNAERLHITSDGKVRVPDNGKFTAGGGDDLQIYHDGTINWFWAQNGSTIHESSSSWTVRSVANENYIVATENGSVDLYHDGSKKLETTTTGVTVTGDVNSTSDINLKKDIEVVSSATEMINELRGVKFTWKENDEKSVGVIAQEVEDILPELVKGEEGEKSVNYSGLVGVLIEAVKELSQEVETLKSIINN